MNPVIGNKALDNAKLLAHDGGKGDIMNMSEIDKIHCHLSFIIAESMGYLYMEWTFRQ